MMQPVPFRIAERELGPRSRVLALDGELDLAVAGRLRAALERAQRDGCEQVMVQLEGCQFIDSTGIAVIVHAHRALAESGGRLATYGAADQVKRVLTVSGLTANGLVFGSLEEALAGKVLDPS
jgi:anti-sigma B factor antagonist